MFFFKRRRVENRDLTTQELFGIGERKDNRFLPDSPSKGVFLKGVGTGVLLLAILGGVLGAIWYFFMADSWDTRPLPFISGAQGPLRIRPDPTPLKPQRRVYGELSLKAPPEKRESLLPPTETLELPQAPSAPPQPVSEEKSVTVLQEFPSLVSVPGPSPALSHPSPKPTSKPPFNPPLPTKGKIKAGGGSPSSSPTATSPSATSRPASLDGLLKGL